MLELEVIPLRLQVWAATTIAKWCLAQGPVQGLGVGGGGEWGFGVLGFWGFGVLGFWGFGVLLGFCWAFVGLLLWFWGRLGFLGEADCKQGCWGRRVRSLPGNDFGHCCLLASCHNIVHVEIIVNYRV